MNLKKKRINGYQIKIIAFISMAIDHFAVIFFNNSVLYGDVIIDTNYEEVYYVLRGIGRISFPLYAFLLIEGIKHTKSIMHYVFRIFMFAIISEIPYDWGVSGKVVNIQHQNIFFELLLGIVVVSIFQLCEKKMRWIGNLVVKILLSMMFMYISEYFRIDYGYVGILVIIMFYLIDNKNLSIIVACLLLSCMLKDELFAWLAVFPIAMYDNTRGHYKKYTFYMAYPIHLIIFRMIQVALQIKE